MLSAAIPLISEERESRMIVIGVDAHKASHTAAAVNRVTAELVGEQAVDARTHGHARLLEWAQGLGAERVWAIEDCRHVSGGLERDLLKAGELVIRVPPKLMASERRSARKRGKSDPIDALAVARAAIREPGLPTARMPGAEREIRALMLHRDALVGEAVTHAKRLRWMLHDLDPELSVPPRSLTQPGHQQRIKRWLARQEQTVQVRVCRDIVRRITELSRSARQIKNELAARVRATHPELLEIPGGGTLCAARIISEVDGVARFRTDAQLAAFCGAAPLDASSGRQQRHRLNRTGNRKLNHALHVIAVTQIRTHPPAKAFYQRRQAAGNTNKEALRVLKRHLTRTVFRTLKNSPSLT
jgi:transposase